MVEWRDDVCGCLQGLHGAVVVVYLRDVAFAISADHRPHCRVPLTRVLDRESEHKIGAMTKLKNGESGQHRMRIIIVIIIKTCSTGPSWKSKVAYKFPLTQKIDTKASWVLA